MTKECFCCKRKVTFLNIGFTQVMGYPLFACPLCGTVRIEKTEAPK